MDDTLNDVFVILIYSKIMVTTSCIQKAK